jgi:signal transduction histidine kinase
MTRREHKKQGTPTPSEPQNQDTCRLFTPLVEVAGPRSTQETTPVEPTKQRRTDAALRRCIRDLEKRLDEQTRELQKRDHQLRALAGELTLAEQRERRRLAEVLHDHLQQLLVGARFRVVMLTGIENTVLRRAAQEVEELLAESIEATRSLTAELSPPILREQGLSAGLTWLAEWMKDRHHLLVDLTVDLGLTPASEDVGALLFESVRELLFNVVKHARVRSAQVNLCRVKDNELQITVSDRGVGFDAASVNPPGFSRGGFGLFSISERLSLMGGRVEIETSPGRGTRVRLMAPCGSQAPQAVARSR